MSAVPKHKLTVEEYLARERLAPFKSEFYNGEAFAMAGASHSHNLIAVSALIEIGQQLKGSTCRVYGSDQRVLVEKTGLICYPDLTIRCGEPLFSQLDPDTLINPQVIFEILSPSTERYDRTTKFRHYQQIPSFQEYVMICQDEPLVEHYFKTNEGLWCYESFSNLMNELNLCSVPIRLKLQDLYAGIRLPEPKEPA